MLSTLVFMPKSASGQGRSPGLLVRTLASLVSGTVEGLIRDVTVVCPGADDDIRRVTEHAGCGLVKDPDFADCLSHALGQTRSSLLFLLLCGAAFERPFIDEVAGLIGPAANPDGPPTLLLRQNSVTLLARLLPATAPIVGIIAPSRRIQGRPDDFPALVRMFGKGQSLTARAHMAA